MTRSSSKPVLQNEYRDLESKYRDEVSFENYYEMAQHLFRHNHYLLAFPQSHLIFCRVVKLSDASLTVKPALIDPSMPSPDRLDSSHEIEVPIGSVRILAGCGPNIPKEGASLFLLYHIHDT